MEVVDLIDVVIPALNEEKSVGRVVKKLKQDQRINSVIVVDNNSTDRTSEAAELAGAYVLHESRVGLGFAMKRGLKAVSTQYCLKTDADIDNWDTAWLDVLCANQHQGGLIRAIFESPYDEFPVTNLVVRPLLRRFGKGWEDIPLPITGTYLISVDSFDFDLMSDDWAFDISLLIQCLEREIQYMNVDIGILSDRKRSIDHYVPMADQIISFFLEKFGEGNIDLSD